MTFREDTGGSALSIKAAEPFIIPVTALHGTARIWDGATRQELSDKLASMAPKSALAIGGREPMVYVSRVSDRTYYLGVMVNGNVVPLPSPVGEILAEYFEQMVAGSHFWAYRPPEVIQL